MASHRCMHAWSNRALTVALLFSAMYPSVSVFLLSSQHNTCPVCRFKFEVEAAPNPNLPVVGHAAQQQATLQPAPVPVAAAASAVAASAGGGATALSAAQLQTVQQYRRLQQQYELATRQLRHLRRASSVRLGHLLEQGVARTEPQQQQDAASPASATTAAQGMTEPPPARQGVAAAAAAAAPGRMPLIEMAEHLARYQVRGARACL